MPGKKNTITRKKTICGAVLNEHCTPREGRLQPPARHPVCNAAGMRPWRVPSTTRYMFNIHGETHFLHCDRTLTVLPLSTPQTPLERRPLPEAGGGRRRRRRQGLLVLLLHSLREDLLPPPLPSGERQVRLQGGHEAVPVRVGRSKRKRAIQVPIFR